MLHSTAKHYMRWTCVKFTSRSTITTLHCIGLPRTMQRTQVPWQPQMGNMLQCRQLSLLVYHAIKLHIKMIKQMFQCSFIALKALSNNYSTSAFLLLIKCSLNKFRSKAALTSFISSSSSREAKTWKEIHKQMIGITKL